MFKASDHVIVLSPDTQYRKDEESKTDLRKHGKLKEKLLSERANWWVMGYLTTFKGK